jgi:hypothetical protein
VRQRDAALRSKHHQRQDQQHNENDDEYVKQNTSDIGTRRGDSGKSENGGNDRNDEKYQRPF